MRLSNRLILLLLLASLGPLFLFGAIALELIEQHNRRDTHELVRLLGLTRSAFLADELEDSGEILSVLASDDRIKREATARAAEAAGLADGTFRPGFSLGEMLQPKQFVGLALLDVDDGSLLAAHMETAGRPFPIEDGPHRLGRVDTHLLPAYLDPDSGEAVFRAVTPVRGVEGQAIAVLAGLLDTTAISRHLGVGLDAQHRQAAYLVDRTGRVLLRNDVTDADLPVPETLPGIEDCLNDRRAGNDSIPVQILARSDGADRLAVLAPLPALEACLVTFTNDDLVDGLHAPFLRNLYLLGLATLVLSLATGLYFGRRMTRPLARLRAVAIDLGQGHLERRIGHLPGDELNDLAGVIDGMAENLQRTLVSREALSEEAARRSRSEAHYRTLFESSPDLIMTANADTMRLVSCNPATLNTLGYDMETFRTLELSDIDTQYETLHPSVEKALGAGGSGEIGFMTRLRKVDGKLFPARMIVRTFQEDGQAFLLGIAHDLTELQEYLAALQESQSRFRRTLDIAPYPLVVHDEDGRIEMVNRSWMEHSGYTAERLRDLPTLHATLFPDDAGRLDREVQALYADRQQCDFGEIDVHVASQAVRRWHVMGARVGRSSDGHNLAICMAVDVTEARERESRLEALAASLERSNEDLQRFAYSISHDLQEPLRMVSGFSDLFVRRYRDQVDARGLEYLDYITGGTRRMREMIDGLLDFSRVASRAGHIETFSADAVLDEVLTDLGPRLAESGGEVTRAPLPSITADRNQIRQVLQNLVGNALKFHGEAPPRVHIGAVREDATWHFTVTDHGIGLDPAQAERAFEIFQRLHTVGTFEGSGMGLAICKRIIERHDGRIWLEASPGKGATCHFTLPVDPHTDPDPSFPDESR